MVLDQAVFLPVLRKLIVRLISFVSSYLLDAPLTQRLWLLPPAISKVGLLCPLLTPRSSTACHHIPYPRLGDVSFDKRQRLRNVSWEAPSKVKSIRWARWKDRKKDWQCPSYL